MIDRLAAFLLTVIFYLGAAVIVAQIVLYFVR